MSLCANCQQREGTQTWAGEMDSLSAMRMFSMLPMWCDVCALTAQVAYAKARAAALPELEAKLAAALKTDAPADPQAETSEP